MMVEKTLVLLKPDAVKRGIVGEILHRFERSGLKIVGMKLIKVEREFAKKHYPTSTAYFKNLGDNTLLDCKTYNLDPKPFFKSSDAEKIGEQVWEFLVDFLVSGPVLAVVLEGVHAIQNVRNTVGHTLPLRAEPGSIRGDFSLDSAAAANFRGRAIYNLVHASGSVEEAEREISLWFKKGEILDYKRVHEDLYLY